MTRHVAVLIALSAALIAAATIGVSGTFQVLDAQGILTGPFSALLLLGAACAALWAVVFLDWRVWQPRRIRRGQEMERWLAVDVLGNSAAPESGWTKLHGRFRGRDVVLARTSGSGVAAMTWTMRTASPMELRVVRLERPNPSPPAPLPQGARGAEFSSGDAEFDARYAWQTAQPEQALPALQNADVRAALKRLASLIALRGEISAADAGIRVSNGEISVLQAPAPRPSASGPEERLMILHDLSVLAAGLEGAPLSAPLSPCGRGVGGEGTAPDAFIGGWLSAGCAATVGIVVWMGLTWLLAHFLGLAAAMVGFFIPPVLLALLFVFVSAGGSGREPEMEDAIRREAAALVRQYEELARLKGLMRDA